MWLEVATLPSTGDELNANSLQKDTYQPPHDGFALNVIVIHRTKEQTDVHEGTVPATATPYLTRYLNPFVGHAERLSTTLFSKYMYQSTDFMSTFYNFKTAK